MAFEDRSSPGAANADSPNQSPNAPESSRTSPYTCTTIPPPPSQQQPSPPPPPPPPSSQPPTLPKTDPIFRITDFALDSPVSPSTPHSSPSQPPQLLIPPNEPTIQTLKYSITNILKPDFGKSAVLKTKNKIPFRPYSDNINDDNDDVVDDDTDDDNNVNAHHFNNIINKKIHVVTSSSSSSSISAPPPLGSLSQTVSQIGLNRESLKSKTPPEELLPNPEQVCKNKDENVPTLWPAWVYCTRYSDRPSSGPRSRRMKKPTKNSPEDKRPRTAFSSAQLARLKHEFTENRYLTERRRQQLSTELGLNEAQIKIWFQNKRAKIKKSSGQKNPLALQLMAQGLYNHSTVPCDEDDMPLSS